MVGDLVLGLRVIRDGTSGLFMGVLRVTREGGPGVWLRRTNRRACGLGKGLAGALLEVKSSF